MASSNIKLFDENKGNMLSDSEFIISNQRLNGLQTGVASSQLQNKAMYQASLVAYAIAQIMMQNGYNANDTDAVSAFVANLSGTMLQKVYDLATTAEAQAGVATGKWMSPALVKAAIDYMLANPVQFNAAATFKSTVTLAQDPTSDLQAATKQYVDKFLSQKQLVYENSFEQWTSSINMNLSGTFLGYNDIRDVDEIEFTFDGYFWSIPSSVSAIYYYFGSTTTIHVIYVSRASGSYQDPTKQYHSSITFKKVRESFERQEVGGTNYLASYFQNTYVTNYYLFNVNSPLESNVGTCTVALTPNVTNVYMNGTIRAYAIKHYHP